MSDLLTENHAVIGLSGHVDHGKTALIYALTGMMTARAHEQACGMTQDLGFAHFKDDQGHTIGVIDVPGHERYIRNMVAGVWHLDLVILVVAANEGWMPMTTAHLEVAQAMGMERIVVCITKKDTVTTEELNEVEEAVLERVMDMTGRVPECVAVSALNNDNIDALKSVIVRQLQQAEKENAKQDIIEDIDVSPLLYVDRAFLVNGIGTVVTGTLARGTLAIGDKLMVHPLNKMVKVRTLQSYHSAREQVASTSRVAVGLKGITLKEMKRGYCLTGESHQCRVVNQCIVRFTDHLLPEKLAPERKNRQVEVALGTWHGTAQLIYIKDTGLARLKFPTPVSLFFEQPMALIRHGGSDLLHSAEVVWTDDIAPQHKKALYSKLAALPLQITLDDQTHLALSLQGYLLVTDALKANMPIGCDVLSDFIVDPTWLQKTREQIMAQLNEQGVAMSSMELSSRLRIAVEPLVEVINTLKAEGQLHLSYDKWQQGKGRSEDELPPEALTLLSLIRQKGKDGLELSKAKIPNAKKWLRQLSHQKYITILEGDIYYDMALYQNMVNAILEGHQKHDRISMADIKDKAELSRKYSIPLANRMEMDGWVRRDENDRIVLKVPENDA